jgi:septum formation protein
MGLAFETRISDVPEQRGEDETVEAYVERLAREKAEAVAVAAPDAVVVAADTVVELGGEVLEKPLDRADAARMLEKLSGNRHTVVTGVALVQRDRELALSEVVRTGVRMTELRPEQIAWYVSTGEPMDKAGAYAVQGIGAMFIEEIAGNYTNVVGLPLSTLFRMMVRIGFDPMREESRSR